MDITSEEQTFLIRIRLVPTDATNGPIYWRGTIEHLGSQTKKAIKNEREVYEFIRGFLPADAQEQQSDFWKRWLRRLFLTQRCQQK